jgi:hypothetical protein
MATTIKPAFYVRLVKEYPHLFEAVEQLGLAAKNAGPLEEKNGYPFSSTS